MKNASFRYTKEFDKEFEYRLNDLGAVCQNGTTSFKLWAPFADKVELYLYEDGGKVVELETFSLPKDYIDKYELKKMEKGIFSIFFNENLHGRYYDYLLYYGSETVRTADPYAVGCGCNGCRSMVVDLKTTNPVGFENDKRPDYSTENIIYELHIKDFSYDPSSGICEEYRGKYKAFTVEDSTLNNEGDIPTCVNYLKQLGITHVHLLPFFDYGYLDESKDDDQFNWGYDPLNYNIPEGSFATNAEDGSVRIKECKEMIQALHKAGIKVVMDVVYNHTHEAESWLERSAPGYFCRRNSDGSLSNGSACGSDMAVGRAMVDNYIVNSVMYWAKEYHIDGFRFDLMGLLTTELMEKVKEELDRKYGQDEILLYGEPWRAGESAMEEGTHAALKDNIEFLNPKIAVFSDDTRDLIKGDVFLPKIPGFVNGGVGLSKKVLEAINGWSTNQDGFKAKEPGQIVNYVSAHDNYTLWDKLLLTLKTDAEGMDVEEFLTPMDDILRANKLAAFMYFTFQGHLFMQAGEEFGRSKFLDENSFRSHPEVNMLRWEQTVVFENLLEYYKGLIELRKLLPGLYDKCAQASERISEKTVSPDNIVSFMVDNSYLGAQSYGPDKAKALDGQWSKLYIIYNGSDLYNCKTLPEGKWEILVDGNEANCRKKANKEIVVPARSGMMLGKVE